MQNKIKRIGIQVFLLIAAAMIVFAGAAQTVSISPTVHLQCTNGTVTQISIEISNESIGNQTYNQQILLTNHNLTIQNPCVAGTVNLTSISSTDLFSTPKNNVLPHQNFTAVDGGNTMEINNVTISQPAAIPKTNNAINLTYNESALNNVTNTIYRAPPFEECILNGNFIPSWTGNQVISNTMGSCDVNLTIGKIPGLNLTTTLLPGNSISNSIEGYDITSEYPSNSAIIYLGLGQSFQFPTGQIVEAPTGNDLAGNQSILEQIFSASARNACDSGAQVVTFYDNQSDQNVSICATPNILQIIAQENLETNNLTRGLGQGWIFSMNEENQTAVADQGTINSDNFKLDPDNISSPINSLTQELSDSNGKLNSDQSGTNSAIVNDAVIIGTAFICYLGYRFSKWYRNRQLKKKGGIPSK